MQTKATPEPNGSPIPGIMPEPVRLASDPAPDPVRRASEQSAAARPSAWRSVRPGRSRPGHAGERIPVLGRLKGAARRFLPRGFGDHRPRD